MKENQNIEWKESWRNEYLQWICGFANADGGVLSIGKDDNGNIVELKNIKRLLEDIPNTIINTLNIYAEVKHEQTNEGEYIEIIVEPYPLPISYKGKYYKRIGATNQLLKGIELTKFLLGKGGKKWDGVPIPNININDLDDNAFELFKIDAKKNKRIGQNILNEGSRHILENLDLLEGNTLKRAAILLFHKEPHRFASQGAYIKIGYFKLEEIYFDNEIYGSLFEQYNKTFDLLTTKYGKALMSYERQRIETYEYPEKALREALLNAIAHKDYSSSNPIVIKVYEDKLVIRNEAELPESWTINNLLGEHPSKPHNPGIANTFHRAGYIERWGRGINKIKDECRKHNLPEPIFEYEKPDFKLTIRKDIYYEEHLKRIGLNTRQIKAVLYLKVHNKISNSKYQELCETSKGTATRDLKELTEHNILTRKGRGAGTYYELKY